jgi:hypothetical protein
MTTQTKNPNNTSATDNFEEAADRLRDLNERIIESSRKAGRSYVDAYEKTLISIADFQDRVGKASQVDWMSTLAHAQADFTRNWAEAYTSAARNVLK